jgi:P pilus assembly chaperone PapD
MRRTDRTAGVAVLAVLLGAGLVLVAQPASTRTATPPGPRLVPVEHAGLVCPVPATGEPRSVAAAVTAPSVQTGPPRPSPPSAGRGETGPAVRVTARGRRVGELEQRGATWSGQGERIGTGVRAEAVGPLAGGLTAAVSAVLDGEPRGLTAATCASPASHQWFVGAASTTERTGVLQLTNPTPGVAVVDLALYGPRGPVPASGALGLAIAPGGQTTVPLNDLATGIHPLAVEVITRQGQVAAALTDIRHDVLEPAGADMLPTAAEPRRTSVLTGVPGQGEEHTLAVANPGNSPAVVRIEVLGPRGPYTPTSLQSLPVPPQAVRETRLPAEALDGDVVGLRLTSDQPVTGGVLTASGSPLSDHTFAASVDPTSTLTATPVLPGLQGRLVLSGAGRTAAIVDVVTYSERGRRLSRRTLDVAAGQTRAVPLPEGAGSVQVRAGGSGPVAAAVLWSEADDDGTMASGYPLAPARTTVRQPPVRYRLTAPRPQP